MVPASQHKPGADSGSVSRQCPSSPRPCQDDNLGHICPAKGSKAPHGSGFQVEKVPHLLTAVTPSWECTGEAQPLKEPWRNRTSTQNAHSWPERGSGSRQLFSSSPFIVFFECLRASFSPQSVHPQLSVALGMQVPHMGQQQPAGCVSRVQRAK